MKNLNSVLRVFFVLTGVLLLFPTLSFSQISAASLGSTYTENFNSLSSTTGTGYTWTDNSTIAGWYSSQTTYDAGTGSSTTGAQYSFGSTSAADRCLGSLVSGTTGIIYYGVRIVNNTGGDINAFDITYTGEQWKDNNNTAQKLDFQYQVGATSLTAGTWVDYNSLDFTSPQYSTSGTLNGNVAANRITTTVNVAVTVTNGQEIWFRWKDSNDTGSDDGFGVDDFAVTYYGNVYYYRSFQTGDWNLSSTWENSPDNFSWVPATAPPDYNSLAITILSGHTVTTTASASMDELTISSGGTLVYGNTASTTITINDGTGIDFTINGTFQEYGPSSTVWGSASATWVMGSSGTLVRSRSTSSANWRDHYSGGISSIPSTSNWILRKVGSDNPSITTVGGSYYPNLTFENTSGAAWGTTTTCFTGSSDYPRILGNLDIGGTGTDAVTFINTCFHATPIPVTGNVTIRVGHSLSIGDASSNGTGFEIQGNLIISGTLTYGSNGGSRKIKFSGTNAQTISGSGTSTIYALEINKTTNDVTLSRAITVDNLLNLSQGNFITTSTNLLSLIAGASVSGVTNSSFVEGPMSKTGTTDFIFPVGKGTKYRPISATSLSASETFTAEYFRANPNAPANPAPCNPCDTSSHDVSLNHLSGCEYWILDRAGAANAKVTLSWDAPCGGVTTLANLSVARWDGTTWRDHGNGGTTGGTSPLTGTVISSAAVTSFSPFTLGSTASDNPLPIGLMYFKAKSNGHSVDLSWATGSELNNDYFTIEHSRNGKLFTDVLKTKGAGTTENTTHYSAADDNPFDGISYYRLKQTDFDGNFSYSQPEAVNINGDHAFGINYLIVDHENGLLKMSVSTENPSVSLKIMDALGRDILYIESSSSSDKEFREDISAFSSGIFFVLISDGTNYSYSKFFY